MRKDTERDMHATVRACKRYIETHLCEEVTPKLLAQLYNCSYGSLRRFFKEIGGYGVREYANMRRVNMVARRLREGVSADEALDNTGFASKTGCADAFKEIYGISPWRFAKTRGMELMPQPEIMERTPFTVVGYIFETERLDDWVNNGAYWIIQDFPDISPNEWNRIGGGPEMIGTWVELDGKFYYIFGPGVERVQYVPELTGQKYVPGGLFAVFPVITPRLRKEEASAPAKDMLPAEENQASSQAEQTQGETTTVICENVQVAWYYALYQWLPDSDYVLDETRVPYEYYLSGKNLVVVPIAPKIQPPREA